MQLATILHTFEVIFQQIRTLNEPWTNLLVFYRKFACNDSTLLSHYSNSIFFKFDDERWASHICLWKLLALINRPKSLSLVLCGNFNNSLSPIDRNLSNNENLESVIIPLFERNQPMVNESDKKFLSKHDIKVVNYVVAGNNCIY